MLVLTDEERKIFEDIGRCKQWQMFLFRTESPGKLSAIDTWVGNYGLEGKLVGTRASACILGNENDPTCHEEIVVGSMLSRGTSTADIEKSVRTELMTQD